MSITIARERLSGEHRVALVPETAKKFAALGAQLRMEQGAGNLSQFQDAQYAEVSTDVSAHADLAQTYTGAQLILRVTPPSTEEINAMPEGAVLIGLLKPYEDATRSAAREQVKSFGAKFVDTGVTADGTGGYARKLTTDEIALQEEKLALAVANADVLITTAPFLVKKPL